MTKCAAPVDPNSIVIPKKPANKSASEHRKITKPIMEKKRRARINHSLEQIKDILKENFNECSKKNQLEKADILELTVKYLKLVTKDQLLGRATLTESNANNAKNIQLMQGGFQDCKQKVNQFIAKFDPQLNQRLTERLAKFEREQFESMECQDYNSPLNLSIHDNMAVSNSFMLNTPNSAASTNSQEIIFFPNSAPSTPNSERSMSPIELTVNRRVNFQPWRPF